MHIGVSEEAFQGVTPSFYFSKIQFSVNSLVLKLLLTCRNFSLRNVSHYNLVPEPPANIIPFIFSPISINEICQYHLLYFFINFICNPANGQTYSYTNLD